MGYLLEQYKMVVGILMGDVTFIPHTFLSNQSNSCGKLSQLVLGLAITHQVLFETGVKVIKIVDKIKLVLFLEAIKFLGKYYNFNSSNQCKS